MSYLIALLLGFYQKEAVRIQQDHSKAHRASQKQSRYMLSWMKVLKSRTISIEEGNVLVVSLRPVIPKANSEKREIYQVIASKYTNVIFLIYLSFVRYKNIKYTLFNLLDILNSISFFVFSFLYIYKAV